MNAYAKKLFRTKENAYADGVWCGVKLGINLVAIALNHEYGFADIRLSRLEKRVQKLIDEIVDTADPEVTKAHIETALKQIRGKDWVCE